MLLVVISIYELEWIIKHLFQKIKALRHLKIMNISTENKWYISQIYLYLTKNFGS